MGISLTECSEPSKIHGDYFSAWEKCVCFNVKWKNKMMSYYMVHAVIPYISPSKCYSHTSVSGW